MGRLVVVQYRLLVGAVMGRVRLSGAVMGRLVYGIVHISEFPGNKTLHPRCRCLPIAMLFGEILATLV